MYIIYNTYVYIHKCVRIGEGSFLTGSSLSCRANTIKSCQPRRDLHKRRQMYVAYMRYDLVKVVSFAPP
jgi:hypothetical protein